MLHRSMQDQIFSMKDKMDQQNLYLQQHDIKEHHLKEENEHLKIYIRKLESTLHNFRNWLIHI